MTKRSLLVLLTVPLFLTACFSKGTVKRETVIGKEVLTTVMPTGPVRHPEHGAETWFSVGALAGEAKNNANGVAQLHVFEDDQSIVDVRLNIEKAPAGKQYAVWLSTEAGDKARVGELASILGDVRHAVNKTLPKNLKAFPLLVVTLESTKGAQPNDAVVAKGTLKERKR